MYVSSTRNVISSYDVVFDERFSSALSYTSRYYSEAMAMRPAGTYNPYATSSKEQAGNVIIFAQFEEGNILTETRNYAESGDESDNESIMMVKHASPSAKRVSRYLCWYSRASKSISRVNTQNNKGNIFIRCCV